MSNGKWECFSDPAYFYQWCVRKIGEIEFGRGYHVTSRDEAIGLCGLLNGYESALAKREAVEVICDSKTVCGFEHGQLFGLRRIDGTGAGLAVLFGLGARPHLHRFDGGKIYLSDFVAGDQFTGIYEAIPVCLPAWPEPAMLAASQQAAKEGK